VFSVDLNRLTLLLAILHERQYITVGADDGVC
jgi:predicted ATP-dependent serine protease